MLYLLIWIASAWAGYAIGDRDRSAFTGLFLGLVLGPLGVLAIWLIVRDGTRPCPHCRSRISELATVCPRCARDVPTSSAP